MLCFRWRIVCVWVCGAQFQSNWFLTSCLLALVSAVPEHHQPLGGSQTLRRRERGDTHSHTPQEKAGLTPTYTLCLHAHIQTFTQSLKKPARGGGGGGLTDVCSVWDDQPFLPAVETYTHKHTQRRLVVPVVMCLNVCLNNCLLTFPFAWILLCLFKQPGRWITTPLPKKQMKRNKTEFDGCVRRCTRLDGILFNKIGLLCWGGVCCRLWSLRSARDVTQQRTTEVSDSWHQDVSVVERFVVKSLELSLWRYYH